MTKYMDIFGEKMREAFAMQSFSYILNKNYCHILDIIFRNLTKPMLTNNVVN